MVKTNSGISSMQPDEVLLQDILRRVVSVCKPAKVILFGSFATGQATPDSDVDLLVILPSVGDTRTEGLRIRESLQGLGVAFDIIVMSTERFEETKDVVGGIAYPAHKYGRVLHHEAA